MKNSKRPRLCSPSISGAETISGKHANSEVELSSSSLNESYFTKSLAGKIESLHMINFMCHSNLEMKFNDRITFVTGRNGSGKSTIMAALIVALGGAANATGRGSGITDFIKKGETWAKVTITLLNEGINAYKRDIYGKRITITRTLSKNAASTYSCKSEFEEVISKKKDEVDRIRTALDLQIKNPLCILNQDVARSFLSATDNNVRYAMFMKATHLENLKQIYSETLDLLLVSQKELESKRTGIQEASREVSRLKEKLTYYASLEKYVNQRTSLENEYLWSLVSTEEKNVDALMRKRNEIVAEKENFQEKEEALQSVINKLEDDVKKYEKDLSNMSGSKSEERIKKKDLNLEIQNFQRKIDAANSHLRQLKMKNERQETDLNSIKEHLQQSEEIATQNSLEKERAREKMENLVKDLCELRSRIETTQRDAENGQETKLQHVMTLDNLKTELKDLERIRGRLQFQMESSDAKECNMLKFGPFTPKLKELIDEAAKRNQFLKKPVGPCGLYVSLTGDSKWARAVESVIGGMMNTYCCDNQKDFIVLNQIMEKVCSGKHPPVVISKFQKTRHDVSSKKVTVRGLQSVLDVLTFSSDVVFNAFVDQSRLETILLFESDAQAASLLTHIQNVPKNLRMGLTIQSDQYYPAPNYRTYCGDSSKPLKYFDGSVRSKSRVEKMEEELNKSKLTIKNKNMEIAEVTNKLMKATEFLKKSEGNLKLLRQNERKLEDQISQLKHEVDSKPVLPTRIALEEELKIMEKNLEETREKIAIDLKSIEELTGQMNEFTRKLNEITEMEDQVQRDSAALHEKIEDIKYQLTSKRSKKKKLSDKGKETEAELSKMSEEIAAAKKSLSNRLKAATEVHPERIVTDKSPIEVQQMLEKCEKYLQAAEKNLESREVVINDYKLKHGKYKQMKITINTLEKVVSSLSEVTAAKEERFRLLQSHTANLVSFHFQACLQTRGYDGRLKFDFANELLEIEVVPKDGLLRKDTKTLSGGERSYSTVSFILAIWRVVQMPFYFLDEFDVFMDKVNRKVIMDLLLEHAKNQDKMQFIFITPQDISSIQSSDIVSIFRMPDPRNL